MKIAGVGGEGRYIKMDKDQIETTLDITAPYRFEDLLAEIKDRDITVYKSPDPRRLSRSDLVKITGNVYPMSLLKVSTAIDAFRLFTGKEFNQALDQLGESPIPQSERGMMDALSKVIDVFSGSQYPIRIETDEYTYCTKLEQQHMRQSAFEAFGEMSSIRYSVELNTMCQEMRNGIP